MRLAATGGLEGVSLRHVAAEVGVSAGMVQHYFRTKDEMLTFALRTVMDRIRERPLPEPLPESPPELVRAMLLQMLPLDETRRLENHVVLAFLANAAIRPEIGAELHAEVDQMRDFLAAQVRLAGRPDVDAEVAATGLLALMDGLGLQLLSGQVDDARAIDALDAHLSLVFRSP